MPLISVVIPTHNRPELLRRAILSVLTQTFQDFEVVVVDDGDRNTGVEEVVRSSIDQRIRYITQTKSHSGAPTARNRGAHEARAEIIAFLDDDDEWLPEKLASQFAALTSHPEAVAVFTGVAFYDEKGNQTGERWPRESGIVNVFARTLLHPYIWTSALMVRKDAFEAIGGFDEILPKNQEWDLVLRLSKRQPFYAIDRLLVRLNVQGVNNHLGGRGNLTNIIKGYEMLLAKHAADYAAHPRARARITFILFSLYREAMNVKEMRRTARTAYHAQPWNPTYMRHYFALQFGSRFYFFFFRSKKSRL
ncbi:glycosyltransferase family 2 protein [Candidatus Parcubacteria bacterium]|nr:glycosyltransferase family 2 protein [Candidatus Parcubacteria bacterium]